MRHGVMRLAPNDEMNSNCSHTVHTAGAVSPSLKEQQVTV